MEKKKQQMKEKEEDAKRERPCHRRSAVKRLKRSEETVEFSSPLRSQ